MRVIIIIVFLSLYAATSYAGRVYDLLTYPLQSEESPQVRKEHIVQFMNSKKNKLLAHSQGLSNLSNVAEIMGIFQHSEELDLIADNLRRWSLKYEVKGKQIHLRAQTFEWISGTRDPVVWDNYLVTQMGHYRGFGFFYLDWWSAAYQAWAKALHHYNVCESLTTLKEHFSTDSDELSQCEKAIDFEVWLYAKWYYKYKQAIDNAFYLFPRTSAYYSFFSGSVDKTMSGASFKDASALSLPSIDKETTEWD
jgi:hypothetical protein